MQDLGLASSSEWDGLTLLRATPSKMSVEVTKEHCGALVPGHVVQHLSQLQFVLVDGDAAVQVAGADSDTLAASAVLEDSPNSMMRGALAAKGIEVVPVGDAKTPPGLRVSECQEA